MIKMRARYKSAESQHRTQLTTFSKYMVIIENSPSSTPTPQSTNMPPVKSEPSTMGFDENRPKNKTSRSFFVIILLAVVATLAAALIIKRFMDDAVLFWNLVIFTLILLSMASFFALGKWKTGLVGLGVLMIAGSLLVYFGLCQWIYLATQLPSVNSASNERDLKVKILSNAWVYYVGPEESSILIANLLTDCQDNSSQKCLNSLYPIISEGTVAGKSIFRVNAKAPLKVGPSVSKIYYDVEANLMADCSYTITDEAHELQHPNAICKYIQRRENAIFGNNY